MVVLDVGLLLGSIVVAVEYSGALKKNLAVGYNQRFCDCY